MGLRARLALLLGGAVATLLVVGGLLLTSQLRSGVDAALDASLKVRADALAQQVGADGSVGNFQDGGGGGSSVAAEPRSRRSSARRDTPRKPPKQPVRLPCWVPHSSRRPDTARSR